MALCACAGLQAAPAPAAESASYRVYAAPTGSPLGGARTLEVDPSDPIASPTGWHGTGTTTEGPNASVATGVVNQDGSGVFDPAIDGGASRVFDFPISSLGTLSSFYPAAVTNAFYWVNLTHDRLARTTIFDGELMANFEGPDLMQVLIDRGGTDTNKEPTSTPPRTSPPSPGPPIMALFAADGRHPSIQVTAPGSIAGTMRAVAATFGPSAPGGALTAQAKAADDGVAPGGDACEAVPSGSLTGKIALVDRGTCTFLQKALNVQAAGAVGMIAIARAVDGVVTPGAEGLDASALTIPVVLVSSADGTKLKTASGVTLTLTLGPNERRSTALDATQIVHQYGLAVADRLVGGGVGGCFDDPESIGVREGFADYLALAMTVRPGDTATTPRYIAEYTVGAGARRFPYSTDMAVDPASYELMDVGSGRDQFTLGHNTGQVWASILWDLHWSIGADLTLQMAIDGLAHLDCDSFFTSGRREIVGGSYNAGDAYTCEILTAFARRGLGDGSFDNVPSTFDYSVAPSACRPIMSTEGVTKMRAAVTSGQSATRPLPIRNRGSSSHRDLHWTIAEAATSCASPSDIPWLAVDTTSGTLAPGATSQLTATLTSSGTPPAAAQKALICVSSDDTELPVYGIPVELLEYQLATLQEPPALNSATPGTPLTIPFGLGGNFGTAGLFAAGSPSTQQVDCDTRATIGASAPLAVTPTYDAGANRYAIGVPIDAAWASTCRRVTFSFDALSPARSVELRVAALTAGGGGTTGGTGGTTGGTGGTGDPGGTTSGTGGTTGSTGTTGGTTGGTSGGADGPTVAAAGGTTGPSIAKTGRVTVTGTAAAVPTTCTGPIACKLTLSLSVIQTTRGGRIIALSARKAATVRKTVVVGRATATVAAGATRTVRVPLNLVGRRLLARRPFLRVKLAVTTTAGRTVTTTKLTIKRPKRRA